MPAPTARSASLLMPEGKIAPWKSMARSCDGHRSMISLRTQKAAGVRTYPGDLAQLQCLEPVAESTSTSRSLTCTGVLPLLTAAEAVVDEIAGRVRPHFGADLRASVRSHHYVGEIPEGFRPDQAPRRAIAALRRITAMPYRGG
jgi:hypothetical protein